MEDDDDEDGDDFIAVDFAVDLDFVVVLRPTAGPAPPVAAVVAAAVVENRDA